MPHQNEGIVVALNGRQSRRAALQTGGGLLAALGALGVQGVAAQEATPAAAEPADGAIVVQSFGNGMLFPTQGDGSDMPPYTLYLWDANQSLFLVDGASRTVGVVPAEPVLAGISATDSPRAALVAHAAADGGGEATQMVWALRLVLGEPGSDPNSATYQGEPLDAEEAAAWLGATPAAAPEGAQNLGAGYIIIAGLPGVDESSAGVRLPLG
jgi:hypothetical protein